MDTSEQLSVTVTYRLSDFYAAMARRRRSWLTAFVILATLVIFLPLLFALLDGCTLRCAWASMDWRFSGLLFLIVVAWLFVAPLLGFLLAKRRGDLGPITFTLMDTGVELKNRDAQSVLFWTGLKQVKGAGSGLLLYVRRSRSIGIPRREFASEAEFEAFTAATLARWERHHRL